MSLNAAERHDPRATALDEAVLCDPTMHFLAPALDRNRVKTFLREPVRKLVGDAVRLDIRGIRVLRHKPGRRCLIQYDLCVETPGSTLEPLPLLGKVRAQSVDRNGYLVQKWLWTNGFAADQSDGIAVPEPVAMVPELHMWLQRRVPGESPLSRLRGEGAREMGARLIDLLHKLNGASYRTPRVHAVADELRILRERLVALGRKRPWLVRRLDRVFAGCERAAASLPREPLCAIHRDFYHDQVLADGDRLFLLDLDLFCAGDPALDLGNFIGHLIEYSLRCERRADGFGIAQEEMERRFAERHLGRAARTAVETYTTLTLARHIQISTQFRDRRPFTEDLLELCEARLGLASGNVI